MGNSKSEAAIHAFRNVMDLYAASEKKPRDYGTGCILYRSEIHTIDAIGKHSHINVTGLSAFLGITKSAVSQMIDRLINKGMVTKTVLSKSDTEVALALTEKGEKVFRGHMEDHQKLYSYVDEMLNQIPSKDIAIFCRIMKKLEEFIQ